MRPPFPHSNFFSSLKQVEKRLKLDNPSQCSNLSAPPPPPLPPLPPLIPPGETSFTPVESLSTPIYLNFDQPNNKESSFPQDSEPPREFLSNSLDFVPTQENPHPKTLQESQPINKGKVNGVDEIELLIQLLGLSNCKEEKEVVMQNRANLCLKKDGGNCCDDCGFYGKIVGVKGPKCGKEVERIEGWIKHFMSDGGAEMREPLILAHLLLAKAAFLSESSHNFEGLEFPSAIEEFLHNDPPEGKSYFQEEAHEST